MSSLGDPLRLPVFKRPVPRAAISLSPSEPTEDEDQVVLVVVTVLNVKPGGSVVITQSGDLIDTDFDDTLINTIVAAAAATTGVTFNVGTRRLTFGATFSGVFIFLRTITSDPPIGQTYTLTLSNPLGGMTVRQPTNTFVTSVVEDDPPILPENIVFGMTLAGGDFGVTDNYNYGTNYLFPSNAGIQHFYNRGVRQFRIPFRWSRTQPIFQGLSDWPAWLTATDYVVASGETPASIVQTDASTAYICIVAHTSGVFATDLAAGKWAPRVVNTLSVVDTNELDRIAAFINTLPNAVFIPDCHEFIGRRPRPSIPNVKLGSSAEVPIGSLGEFWGKLAADERNGVSWNDYGVKCRIGLWNEPQSFVKDVDGLALTAANSWSAEEWKLECFADLAALRAAGCTQKVHIPGVSWTGAHSWIECGNGAEWEWNNLTAPQKALLDNTIFEMHQYLDSDSSGSSPIATVGAGSTRLVDATNWARANGYVQGNADGKPQGICLGEIGFADNPQMITELQAILGYALDNGDVWEGLLAWAAGQFWAQTYMYLLEPGNGYSNPIDKPQMFVLMDMFIPVADQLPPTSVSLSNNIMSAAGLQGAKIGDLTAVDPTVNDIIRFRLTDNGGGKVQLVGKEIQYGSVAPVLGETVQGEVEAFDRSGGTLALPISLPVLAPPNVGITQAGGTTVDEGQNLIIRTTVSAIAPGTSWRFWISGNAVPQVAPSGTPGMTTWEYHVRPVFEAAGYQVSRVNGTTMRITMLPNSVAGIIDTVLPTLADAQTEGANFQANFFMDTASGVTLSPAVSTAFIRDTSQTPGWSISVGAGSVFPGGTITTQIRLVNGVVGAKVTVTPSGVANDADFTATFDSVLAAAVALGTEFTYNAGTNELEKVAAGNGILQFDRVVDIDDDPDEVYTMTLSGAVASVISVGADVVNVLIRQQQGTVAVNTINYAAGETINTTPGPHLSPVRYRNSDDSMKDIAANELCIGDRGLLFSPPMANLFNNPRGEGGTVGTTTLPTGWLFTGAAAGWTFVGRFTENGMPFVRLTRNFTAAAGATDALFGLATQIPASQGGNFVHQVGIRLVAGTFTSIAAGIRLLSATGATLGKPTGDFLAPGANTVWYTCAVSVTAGSSTAFVQGSIGFPGVNAIGQVTIDIFTPSIFTVPLLAGPLNSGTIQGDLRYYRPPLPPSGTIATASNVALTADLNIIPPAEGTFIVDYWSESRWGGTPGECLLSLYSDEDNYIEVRQHIFGALELWVVKDGEVLVTKTDPITETSAGFVVAGKRQKIALVYGLFDVRLVHDGRLLCSAAPAAIPLVNKIRLARDHNDANHAHMVVQRLIYRNDLRETIDLLADTLKPGILGSPGVNLAGGEFGNVYPGKNRVNYFFSSDEPGSKSAGGVYWQSKLGVVHQRIPFKWQRVQPVWLGPLDESSNVSANATPNNIGYLGLMDQQINNHYANGGMTALVDMHNYGGYVINDPRTDLYPPFGPAQINVAPGALEAWIDCWEKLTTHYLGNPAVKAFDIMNEFYAGQTAVQLVINAIAAIDPTRVIYVEGGFSAGLSRWPGSSDSTRLLTHPVDTAKYIVFSAHTYLDRNLSGVYSNTYSGESGTPDKMLTRLLPFDNWRIAHGLQNRKVGVNECGAPTNNLAWILSLSNGIKMLHEYDIEFTGWIAGEAAGGSLVLEPTGGAGPKTDRAGLVALTRNRYQGTGLAQTFSLSASSIVSASAAGTLVGNVTASDGGVITGLTLIDTVGNRFALDSLALEAGATATNFATAQQHVVVLNGLIDGVPTTGPLTITVTQVPTAPAIFVLSGGDNIVSGSPAGTLVSPVVSDTGAPVTSLTITVTAGSRFALDGNDLVAGAVATDYAVATTHSITLEGLIGGVLRTQVFPSIDVTPAPAAREFRLSAASIQSGAPAGTLVGSVFSDDGIVSNLSLTDSAGNRFAIGFSNQLEAGSVATNINTAVTHSITLEGLIGGVLSSTTLTVNVTQAAPAPTFVFLDFNEIASGAAAGSLVTRVAASNGVTIHSWTLTDTAGNRFAAQGATPNNLINAGAVPTDINTATSHQITMRGLFGTGGPTITQIATIVVKPAITVIYNLSGASIQSGAAPGTVIGTFSGSNGGALTGLSLTQTSGSRFALSGNNLVAGAVATDFATANSHLITLTGFIGGVERTQNFTITVNSVGFGLVNLGKVRASGVYAANVWDMEIFDNKLWLGTGNSASSGSPGPEQNAGSGDLFYWDLITNALVNSTYTAAEINDEQISRFRVIGGQLVFPGIDPRSGSPIYFHRLESGAWVKYSVGSFNHTFDVYPFGGKWFAATGTDVNRWNIFRKTDVATGIGGWAATQTSADITASRGDGFFEHSGNLYANLYQVVTLHTDGFPAVLVVWNGTKFVITGTPTRPTLFPGFSPYGAPPGGYLRVEKPLNMGTSLVYIGGSINNDSHWNGQGLFVATASFASVTRVTLNANERPWDLIARGSTAYVLTSELMSSNPQVFRIRVRSSTNLTTWTEIVSFDRTTHARSFEEYNGDFFFGLGTDRGTAFETSDQPSYTDVVKPESGTLLRWTPATPPPPPGAVTVVIDLLDTKQTLQGFGSSSRVFTDPHVYNNFNAATGEASTVMTQAQKNDVYDKLYVDLKLTRVRPIQDGPVGIENVNDNADPLVANAAGFAYAGKRLDYHITWVQAAIARGVDTYWLSPQYPFESWLGTSTDKNEYCEWAMQQLLRFQAAGLEMPYFSLINEPGLSSVTGAWMRDTIKLLGPRMRAAGLDTMIVAPDDVRSTESTSRATTILADATALSYVGALATHLYDQNVSNMAGLKSLAATYSLPVWMTEFSLSGMGSAGLPETAFEWAKLVHTLIANYDVTAVDYMWAAFGQWSDSGKDSLIKLNNSGATYLGYTLQKQYYMFGQFSRFVPPGSIRVDAVSDDATILATAYKDGTDIIIVAINNSGQNKTVQFSGLGAKTTVAPVRTSTTEDWAVLSAIAVAGGAFTAVLTPNSVTTFTA